MKIKIDKGLPIPKGGSGQGVKKYPLKEMKPEDSFFFPIERKFQGRVRSAVASFQKRQKKQKFTVRAVTENGKAGVRVWRVK